MNASLRPLILVMAALVIASCSSKHESRVLAEIKTTEGDIVIALSNLTPGHRDNFIRLAESGFYDGVAFHRVIKEFMIQTGDGSTKPRQSTITDYTVPAEITDSLINKRGAVAAAREGDDVNPARSSSGTQFYIVQGKRYNDEELAKTEQRIDYNNRQFLYNKALSDQRLSAKTDSIPVTEDEMQQNAILKVYETIEANGPYKMAEYRKEIYRTIGGAPYLDGSYTVFGEVVEGMDVVDAIGNTATDMTDKPVNDIRILKVKIIRK